MEQRYFIAIVPPAPLVRDVVAIKQEFAERFNSKAGLRSPAHITLHMPFLWKEEKEDQLIETLSAFAFTDQPTNIELNGYDHFDERVIFIRVSENLILQALQKRLVRFAKERLQLFNQSDDLRGFHPHITVAFRDLRKRYFEAAWAEFSQRSFNATFPLQDFSLLKHDGKQWNVLRTFALHVG